MTPTERHVALTALADRFLDALVESDEEPTEDQVERLVSLYTRADFEEVDDEELRALEAGVVPADLALDVRGRLRLEVLERAGLGRFLGDALILGAEVEASLQGRPLSQVERDRLTRESAARGERIRRAFELRARVKCADAILVRVQAWLDDPANVALPDEVRTGLRAYLANHDLDQEAPTRPSKPSGPGVHLVEVHESAPEGEESVCVRCENARLVVCEGCAE